MGSLSFSEIFTIALVILIIFGPNRLPELSRKIGQLLAWGRRSMQDFTNQINAEFGDQTQPLADLRKDVEGIRSDLSSAMEAMSKPLSTPLAPDRSPEPGTRNPESGQNPEPPVQDSGETPDENPDTGIRIPDSAADEPSDEGEEAS